MDVDIDGLLEDATTEAQADVDDSAPVEGTSAEDNMKEAMKKTSLMGDPQLL